MMVQLMMDDAAVQIRDIVSWKTRNITIHRICQLDAHPVRFRFHFFCIMQSEWFTDKDIFAYGNL